MIKWTPLAKADAHDTFDHIALDDPKTAQEVVRRIESAVTRLGQFPNIGRPGGRPGTRELVLPRLPYVVVYRHKDDLVTILRVLHTSRKPEHQR